MNPDPQPPVPEHLKEQIKDLDGMSDEMIEERLNSMRKMFEMFSTSTEEMKEKFGLLSEKVQEVSKAVDGVQQRAQPTAQQPYNRPTDGGSATLSAAERAKRRDAAKRQSQARRRNRKK